MGYKRKKLTHVHSRKSAKRVKKSCEKPAGNPKNIPPDRFPVEKHPVSASLLPSSSSSSEDEEEDPFMKLVQDLVKDTKRAHSDGETEEDSEPEDEEAEEHDDSGEAEEDADEESGSDVVGEEEEVGSDVVDEEEEDEEVGSDVADEDEEAAGEEEAGSDVVGEEEEVGSDVADEEEEDEEVGSDVADEEEGEEGEAGSDEEEEAGSDVADEEEAGSDVADEEEEAGSDVADEEEEAGSDVADEEEEAGSDVADEEEEAGSDVADEEEEAGSDVADEEEEAGSDVADEEEAGSDVADEEEAGSDVADEEEEASGDTAEEEEAGSDVADEEEEAGGDTADEEAGSVEGDEDGEVEEEAGSVEADGEEEGKDDSGAEEDENDTDVNSDDADDDVLAESDGSDDSCASENDSDCDDPANNLEDPAMPDVTPGGKDPFIVHFEQLIPESSVKKLEAGEGWQKKTVRTDIGKCLHVWNCDNLKANVPKPSKVSFDDLHIKKRIPIENLKSLVTDDEKGVYSASQVELFLRMYSYQDIYYSEKTYKNQKPIEMAYCLHVLNHTLKSRLKVTANNLKQKAAACRDGTEEYPDQGITRPKVLIIVPFRETARRIVSNFIKILTSDKSQTDNKKRFFSEYSSQDVNNFSNKPEDYVATFAGNIDDHFKIGLGISQKKLQIYTKFYSSDIIIGSPLGLRSVIGETQSKKEFDFLSSIEILILDQTEIFLMQNWEHILYIMDHLHLQPKDSHGCDFSRVRAWALNSWNKYYRQTLVLSSLSSPLINVLFNKYSLNYAGKLMLCPGMTDGSICQVALQIPMILPKYRGVSNMNSTMIFIPSYFDFVRIRNYFIKNEIDFLQISEYSKRKDIAGTRSRFFLGKTNFLLYTERHHFYFRTRLRGIRHIIFYELPLYPHFFSEICNLINDVKLKNLPKDDATGSILYSKYDVQRLAAVVGTNRSSLMIHSPKPVHMFVTEP
ncbi:digestive organ expansion factor homolog [Octopus vulgaris]|uniref:U3 small nucleolar RNA-associated protein 25 homolog n=1 Tax=Octopus vulgaris TaxID=6645 RepID=A0AA36B9L7_OCTVU|nr:digestive organ expansion factor homolog [Octopus vulgaris]